MAWEEIEAPEVAGSADRGINLIKGNETPNEIVAMAYGMEKGVEGTGDMVRQSLSNNLCRCTGYDQPVKAVLKSAENIKGGGDA